MLWRDPLKQVIFYQTIRAIIAWKDFLNERLFETDIHEISNSKFAYATNEEKIVIKTKRI